MSIQDSPKALRAEDSFDIAAMQRWLNQEIPGLTGLPEVQQFPGGASNLTYLLTYPDRELILRRPPAGTKAASAHDMAREFTVQQHLQEPFGLVPQVYALCQDHEVIGSDFYVMERLQGVVLRANLPANLPLSAQQARVLSEHAVDVLVQLHQVDPDTAGLRELGRGTGYVNRQVAGWSKRYRAARTENVPDFAAVMVWLAENQPDDVANCVIHNDYRLDNLVLNPTDLSVRGVLDWEMATLGDPLMDLGGALAYWVEADDDAGMQSARRQPTNVPGMLTRQEVVDRYASKSGLSVQDWPFYEVFGMFRVAVIAQQIYYRYHHGQTTNPAFKDFCHWVTYAEWRCRQVAGLPSA
ncbi:MAG: phosphotransferase family protein [Actinomycetia bacterium]|nr:phosphotransferase family protein [Actinomycetes bacterium]